MILSASSLTTNILVTVLVILFVLLMPHFDRKICRKLGINPTHRLTGNSREVHFLRLRELVLYLVLLIYMLIFVYLVFFSRSASEDYMIHVDPLNDLMKSVRIDTGIIGMLTTVFSEGLEQGIQQIHVEKPEDIAQIYMNIMLFVPMGYLLPYVFNWVQKRVRVRPLLCCFLISFITENLQLIFKRGFYDIDDLLANTLGGFLGQCLYIWLAYIVENPNWRKDLSSRRRWKLMARRRTLYPFASKIGTARTTIVTGNSSKALDFYINKLGFMLEKEVSIDGGKAFLMKIGSYQLEIIRESGVSAKEHQYLTLSVKNIVKVRKRLIKCGFDVGDFELDPYTDLRKLEITGPDHVIITFIEA